MTRQLRPLFAVLMGLLVCTFAATRGDDKKEPPAKAPDHATGSVADEMLAKKAPAAGILVTKKSWEELLKAWDIKQPFEVDFDKQLVIVATNQGSVIKLTTALDDKGNLGVKVVATADLRPGFRYAMQRVDRSGIKTINGKPVPKE